MIGAHSVSIHKHGPRGFSLVELLVALTICAIVSAGIAVIVPPARAAFEATPAEMELQQRGRVAVDVILQSIRGAGGDVVAADGFGPFSGVVPPIIPYGDADGRFTRLKVIAPRADAAQAVLAGHQSSSWGTLPLANLRCPSAPVLCGFSRDAEAIIFDGSGRFDVFTVASVDAAGRQLSADRGLVPPYDAGSVVLEADVYTLQLQQQPDHTRTLVRVTAGGAVQPIVDRVTEMAFELHGVDETGTLATLPSGHLTDGPWLRGDPDGSYDEDVFRVRRVDVMLTLQAAPPSTMARTFRFGAVLRNVP